MFVSIELGVEDVAGMRLAISPLGEAAYSVWVLSHPNHLPVERNWRRSARHRLHSLDADGLLRSLARPSAMPDFITPRPSGHTASIDDELAWVRATSPDVVRRDLLATYWPEPLPRVLRDAAARSDEPVDALLDRICRRLKSYWDSVLAPIWPALRLVLEGDTTYRAHQLANRGPRGLLNELHPHLRWRDGVLRVHGVQRGHHSVAAGRGLLLMPSVFAPKPTPPLIPGQPPWLAYPARGVATLWAPSAATAPGALAALLGRPRARVLRLIDEPTATSELARRLHVTPSAISQHLKVLREAGLVSHARDGRYIRHRRTELGEQLLAHTFESQD